MISKKVSQGQVEFDLCDNPAGYLQNELCGLLNGRSNLQYENGSHLARAFFAPKVAVWQPHRQFSGLMLTCPNPNCSATGVAGGHNEDSPITTKGWPNAPRIVYGHDALVYVFTQVYFCSRCKKKVFSHRPDFLGSLPYHVI